MRAAAHLCVLLLATPATAQDGGAEPLSAIDWLSDSVRSAPGSIGSEANSDPGSRPTRDVPAGEAPVTEDALPPEIAVLPLDAASPDRVGLLPSAVTGLPRDLWAGSEEETLITLIQAERLETLPAIRELMVTLMLAEGDPPLGAGPEGRLFLARVDKLLDLGALDPAQALLEAAGPDSAQLFRRWFDVSLLTGTEARACATLIEKPDISSTYSARIFCLARSGDWPAAALTLDTGAALGTIDEEDAALLARFLDPELFEGDAALPPPARLSPLVFRMREAIGEGLPTADLPRAFAHADLRDTMGWKTRLDAAERLARSGAVDDNVLLGLYTAQRPAASGGVWERVAAIQGLEAALAGDGEVGPALVRAWSEMAQARLEVPFARLFAERLRGAELSGGAGAIALRVGLLSPGYEALALEARPADGREAFLVGIALGDISGMAAGNPREAAVQMAFGGATPPESLTSRAANGQLGEALLRAIALVSEGAQGDPGQVTDALAFLRAVGLEDLARRAALQYLILERS